MKILNHIKGKRLLKKGRAAQAQKRLEKAYALYAEAAGLGNADAMIAIGRLYMQHGFRPVKASALGALLAQGGVVMPWDVQEKLVPDAKTALAWYRKAADAGHAEAMRITGTMLCEGTGCKKDLPLGLDYLDKAVKKGSSMAKTMRSLYIQPPRRDVSDKVYERWLADFQREAAQSGPMTFTLYEQLKSGSDAQLARLGYVLTTRQNRGEHFYDVFKPCTNDAGVPLIPVVGKRGAWQTFLRIDLNAFQDKDTLIAISSDICVETILRTRSRLREVGRAVYRSPAFGWLGEEKTAAVFRIDPGAQPSGEELEKVIADFLLREFEYAPENIAFLVETGEKEYSVEIAAITGDKVDVLYRYTIGGSEVVRDFIQPELLSLTLHE